MTDLAARLAPWAHPILGGFTVVLAFRAAAFALASRRPGPAAALARARHGLLAPWVYVLVLVNWGLGLWTVWARRPTLEAAASGHFTVGTMLVLLLTGSALLSRRIATDPRARVIHPWLGAVALLAFGVQVFLGLQLMP